MYTVHLYFYLFWYSLPLMPSGYTSIYLLCVHTDFLGPVIFHSTWIFESYFYYYDYYLGFLHIFKITCAIWATGCISFQDTRASVSIYQAWGANITIKTCLVGWLARAVTKCQAAVSIPVKRIFHFIFAKVLTGGATSHRDIYYSSNYVS